MFEFKSVFEILFKFNLVYILVCFENKIEKKIFLPFGFSPKACSAPFQSAQLMLRPAALARFSLSCCNPSFFLLHVA